MFGSQKLQCAAQTGFEVVGPFVNFGVDVDGFVWDIEFVGGKLLGLNVGHFDLVAAFWGLRVVNYTYSKKDVGRDGHGEDGVEGVVDVFADNVDSAGRARYKVWG